MSGALSRLLLRLARWKVSVTIPDYPKAIICVAPHTSNWDFVLGELAIRSVGRRAGFLMKASWFRWPLGALFRHLGGVPVQRSPRHTSLVDALIDRFRHSDHLVLAITPEGTRARVCQWHTGFLQIAHGADIPIGLAAIDATTRTISLDKTFTTTGDPIADINAVKTYYRRFTALKPQHFCADPQ